MVLNQLFFLDHFSYLKKLFLHYVKIINFENSLLIIIFKESENVRIDI
jgi:hypothetical protein